MKAVADTVITGGTVADIGCDHAFVSIYLIEKNLAERVIASDVRKGPVDIARKNIAESGLSDRISLRMGNGLETLRQGEADAIIIAGLGGMLMLDILRNGKAKADTCKQLILQPQSDIYAVRKYLYENGYFISKEDMVIDAGKYYNILDVRVDNADLNKRASCGYRAYSDLKEPLPDDKEFISEIYFKFGKYLLQNKNEVLLQSLLKQYMTDEKIISALQKNSTDNARKRKEDIEKEQSMISFALKEYFDYKI